MHNTQHNTLCFWKLCFDCKIRLPDKTPQDKTPQDKTPQTKPPKTKPPETKPPKTKTLKTKTLKTKTPKTKPPKFWQILKMKLLVNVLFISFLFTIQIMKLSPFFKMCSKFCSKDQRLHFESFISPTWIGFEDRVWIKRITIAKCDPFFNYRDANIC